MKMHFWRFFIESNMHRPFKPNTMRRTLLAGLAVSGFIPVYARSAKPSSQISLSKLSTSTLYLAHRGSSALYPEQTYTAFDGSLKNGQLLLECDVRLLADGKPGLMHDSTVDRTTRSTGNVSSFTESGWRDLRIDANTWHGSNYGDALSAPLFSDWVSKYKGSAILAPEDKDQRSMTAIMSILQKARVSKDQVLLQCFALNPLLQAVAENYPACYLGSGAENPSSAVASGVTWGGLAASATDDQMRTWVASGLKVLVWTVNRRYIRDTKLALGARGFFSDDPAYLKGNVPLYTTDRFDLQTWISGMLGNSGDLSLPGRGQFFANSYWGYGHTTAGYSGCLQGYLCPIKGVSAPKDYQISLSITFGPSANDDLTRWASVFVATDDRPFVNSGSDSTAGYHILFRKNGNIDVYRKKANLGPELLAGVVGAAITNDQEVRYRISVSASEVTAARLNSDGTIYYSTTALDTSSRGGYLHLGRAGLACKFRHVSVT